MVLRVSASPMSPGEERVSQRILLRETEVPGQPLLAFPGVRGWGLSWPGEGLCDLRPLGDLTSGTSATEHQGHKYDLSYWSLRKGQA